MTQGEICPIKSWKENRDLFLQGVLSRATFRRSPVSGQKLYRCSLFISATFTQKRRALPRSSSHSSCIMISQEVHFVAGDFNGIAWQRFHTEEHDHTCRVGCPNEPDSLTHYNECPRLYNIFVSFWRHATILPQRNRSLHDLITRVFIQSRHMELWYWASLMLLFMPISIAKIRESWKFSDCMKGRIRCLRPRISGNVSCSTHTLCPHPNSESDSAAQAQARYPYLPNARSITRERGNDYRGWAILFWWWYSRC